MKKKLMSMFLAFTLLCSMVAVPELAYAGWTNDGVWFVKYLDDDYTTNQVVSYTPGATTVMYDEGMGDGKVPKDPLVDLYGTLFYGNDIYTKDQDRAKLTYNLLGTTASTEGPGSDLSTVTWTGGEGKINWKENDYLWISVELSDLNKGQYTINDPNNGPTDYSLAGFESFSAGVLYDPAYLTTAGTADQMFTSLKTIATSDDKAALSTASGYEYTMPQSAVDYGELADFIDPNYTGTKEYLPDYPAYPTETKLSVAFDSGTAKDPNDLKTSMKYDRYQLNYKTNTAPRLFTQDGSYGGSSYSFNNDTDVHPLLVYCFKMGANDPSDAAAYGDDYKVVQGYADSGCTYTADEGNLAIIYNTNTPDAAEQFDTTAAYPLSTSMALYMSIEGYELDEVTTPTSDDITLTYDANGGTFSGSTPKTETISKDTSEKYYPTKAGTGSGQYAADLTPPSLYEFKGWYTKDGGYASSSTYSTDDADWGDKIENSTDIAGKDTSGAMTVYARYALKTSIDITYDANGGNFGQDSTPATITSAKENVAITSGTLGTPTGNAKATTDNTTNVNVVSDLVLPAWKSLDGWWTNDGNSDTDGDSANDYGTQITPFPGYTGYTGDTTVYAKYNDINSATITYHPTGESESSTTYTAYTFTDSTATKTETITKPAGGAAVNPTLIADADKTAGTLVETYLQAIPGYEFKGWYTKNGYNSTTHTFSTTDADWGTQITTASTLANDIDLYARYTPLSTVKITYNANNTDGFYPVATSVTMTKTETVSSSPWNPTLKADGDSNLASTYLICPPYKEFDAWYTKDGTFGTSGTYSSTASDWGTVFNTSTVLSSSAVTVYAKYKDIVTYHITYMPTNADHPTDEFTDSGNSTSIVEDVTKTAGPDYPTLKATIDGSLQEVANFLPVPAGQTFAGWWTKDGTGGDWGTQVTTSTALTNHITVYPKYESLSEYKVTYKPGDGTYTDGSTEKTESVAYVAGSTHHPTLKIGGVAVSTMLTPPTGYEFDKWVLDSDGTTTFDTNSVLTGNVTVKALYKQLKVKVVYHTFKDTTVTPNVDTKFEAVSGTKTDTHTSSGTYTADTSTGAIALPYSDITTVEGYLKDVPNGWTIEGWYKETGLTTSVVTGDAKSHTPQTDTIDIKSLPIVDNSGTNEIHLYLKLKEGDKIKVKFDPKTSDGSFTTAKELDVHKGSTLQKDGYHIEKTDGAPVSPATSDVPNPTKNGATFLGWFLYDTTATTPALTDTEYQATDTFSAAAEYHAVYGAKLEFIDTNLNDTPDYTTVKYTYETRTGDSLKNDTVTKGKDVTTPATPQDVKDVPSMSDYTYNDTSVTPNRKRTYEFKGWYVIDKSKALDTSVDPSYTGTAATIGAYIESINTKTTFDAAVSNSVITKFDNNTTIDGNKTLYAIYIRSNDSKLQEPEPSASPDPIDPGAAFYETTLDGTEIPYTTTKPFTKPDSSTVDVYVYPAPTPHAEFDPAKTEHVMVVTQPIAKAAARMIPADKNAVVKIYTKAEDPANPGTYIETDLTTVANPSEGVYTFTMDLEEAVNNTPNTVYVKVIASDDTENEYEFNILRLTTPGIHKAYGNTAKGLFKRDLENKWTTWTTAQANQVMLRFKSNAATRNKKYLNAILTPSIDSAGTKAPNSHPYTMTTWNSYKNYNYDVEDEYAYFTYMGTIFKAPPTYFVDEYGMTDSYAITTNFSFKYQTADGKPLYDASMAPVPALYNFLVKTEQGSNRLVPGTKDQYDLTNLKILPDLYDMTYQVTGYTPVDTTKGYAANYSDTRKLGIISVMGDASLSLVPAVNGGDSTTLKPIYTAVDTFKYKSLYGFRMTDANNGAAIPRVDYQDYVKIRNQSPALQDEWYIYYPQIYN